MSAAANAAGYLYAHRLSPGSAPPELKIVARQAAPQPVKQPQPVKEPRTPRIEYRKRRLFVVPAAT
jgi:hypothetical protein